MLIFAFTKPCLKIPMRSYRLPKLIMCLLVATVGLSLSSHSGAQALFKCKNTQGAIEYRNTACESNQRDAGAVKSGTVTQVPSNADADGKKTESIAETIGLGKFDLSKFNPVGAIREHALGSYDAVAAGECRSQGGHYFEGAGCLSHAAKNLNPGIGESKMRVICDKLGKRYVKLLNECYAK